jgi:hypothetical protein
MIVPAHTSLPRPKVNIRLMQVALSFIPRKERDPSLVAADTARSLPHDVAAAAPHRRHSSRAGPRAVEGYVPRAGKSQYKQLQAQQGQQVGQGEEQEQRRRVRFSDEGGGSLEMPSAAELAAAASAQAQAKEVAGEAAAQEVNGSIGSSASSDGKTPAGGPPASAGAAAGLAPAASGGVAAPLLVFDIEDPQGPLEAADGEAGEAGGLAAHFGRLRVAESGQAATASSSGGPQPSQPEQGTQREAAVVSEGPCLSC